MKLVVGLGNPGPEYDRTRHNVGFEVVDRLARRHGDPATSVARNKFSALVVDAVIGDEKVMLMKPLTFMNLSGKAVAEAVRFYKMSPMDDLMVIVDDTAVSCGSIKIKPSGGAGGHNGLTDVSRLLGTDSWPRLRIGIDKPGRVPLKNYVLGRFTPEQQPLLDSALDEATDAVACWAGEGLAPAMNRFNRKASA
jgi:PTH1 family peptidyl-tRNA hydrolase